MKTCFYYVLYTQSKCVSIMYGGHAPNTIETHPVVNNTPWKPVSSVMYLREWENIGESKMIISYIFFKKRMKRWRRKRGWE